MSELTLRPARLDDIPLLRRWDTQPHVVASDAGAWDWEEDLAAFVAWRESLIAELDERPIGFLQILDPARDGYRYWAPYFPEGIPQGLRAIDIWIGEADDLNQGHGTRMMRLALQRCFAPSGVSAVYIDPMASNRDAHRFYERLGFRYQRDQLFGDDHCRVYRLTRADWKQQGDQ